MCDFHDEQVSTMLPVRGCMGELICSRMDKFGARVSTCVVLDTVAWD